MTRYDLAYLAATPVLATALAWKAWRKGKYRESAPAMLGRRLGSEDADRWRQGCIWVHAVSVGEAVAARAMLPLLKKAWPDVPVLLTTVTETGQAAARDMEGTLVDAVRYFPADFSWIVKRFLGTYRPKVLVLMETELWPNVLDLAAASGAPIVVMNGKISERSFRGYSRFGGILRGPLSRISAYCMQTEGDARRIGELIGDPSRVTVTGNCKFDVPMEAASAEKRGELRAAAGLAEDQRTVIAGSTHPGEEEIILRAFEQVRMEFPDTVLLLVPRHPERFNGVWAGLQASGFAARRMSDGETTGSDRAAVVLVDRMGILSSLYGIGDVALVAGSFVPGIGGHNLLEAAVHGVPVVYGPYMYGQPDMVRILGDADGGTRSDPDDLGARICALLRNRADAAEKGRLGREAVLRNRGAAERNLDVLRRIL